MIQPGGFSPRRCIGGDREVFSPRRREDGDLYVFIRIRYKGLTLTLRHPLKSTPKGDDTLNQRRYRTGQFAKLTSVTLRTLRYYDTVGLLPPSGRTDAGYRLYTDGDLTRLQQILALKFLGFPLDEIKRYLTSGPAGLRDALREQRVMVAERRQQLDAIARAIDQILDSPNHNHGDWDDMLRVIHMIQMEQQGDWRKKYFSDEQIATTQAMFEESYSETAKARFEELHPTPWTEEDQQRIDQRYAALWAGVKRLVAANADPGDPEAQALAGESLHLIEAFTGGDPEIAAGLDSMWANVEAMPAEERLFEPPLTNEEQDFLKRAKAICQERRT